jgi:hypothetical protein
MILDLHILKGLRTEIADLRILKDLGGFYDFSWDSIP